MLRKRWFLGGRKVKLEKLIEKISYKILQGKVDISIDKIEYDSRKVKEGDMFVCIKGLQSDGHEFATMAVEKGAKVILCQTPLKQVLPEDVTIIQVDNSRKSLAEVSVAYYDHPSTQLSVVGITGTNGKTTTTYLIQSVLKHIGKKVGVIGTIENCIGEKVLSTQRTTPESKELQELFALMVEENVSHGIMEISSHALDLYRVEGVSFEIGVFTNLTQDHLDYHITMENYKKAKGMLFERAEKSVINIDDPVGIYMKEKSKGEILTYGIEEEADLKAQDITFSLSGTKFKLVYKETTYIVELNTPGRFSVYNGMAAIGACLFLGVSMEDILEGLKENQGVVGRFQGIQNKIGIQAVVDYAHTPDGLENILKTAKEFVQGNIITVFGCGGDRDKVKRPLMGEIAGRYSDFAIITSDNPRTELPEVILEEIEVGMQKTDCKYKKILDRQEAIQKAVSIANIGDLIIVAGKGHETYQVFADKTIDFDDMEELRKAFGENNI